MQGLLHQSRKYRFVSGYIRERWPNVGRQPQFGILTLRQRYDQEKKECTEEFHILVLG
jgi:hypothetical protein